MADVELLDVVALLVLPASDFSTCAPESITVTSQTENMPLLCSKRHTNTHVDESLPHKKHLTRPFTLLDDEIPAVT